MRVLALLLLMGCVDPKIAQLAQFAHNIDARAAEHHDISPDQRECMLRIVRWASDDWFTWPADVKAVDLGFNCAIHEGIVLDVLP